MQAYVVDLKSDPVNSFRCQKAANSLDIDINKKLTHHLEINADIPKDFTVGLIVGASGSGKTTLAKKIYGDDCFKEYLDLSSPVIEQLPKEYEYDECAKLLSGIGLTSVPCWIRPAGTLSNGQRARAEAVLAMCKSDSPVIDEWTSVVDRTVAKVMSHSIQKYARKNKKQIVLCSCHYDVIPWLDPDWVIDCNKQEFLPRGSLSCYGEREEIKFDIKPCPPKSWSYFSKYHYLSDRLPGGKRHLYGLYCNGEQVGFQCFANYVPRKKGTRLKMHSNRTVIHPDYVGFGLGVKLVEKAADHLKSIVDCDIYAKFSSIPMYKNRIKNPKWRLVSIDRNLQNKWRLGGLEHEKKNNFARVKVKTYTFKYTGFCSLDSKDKMTRGVGNTN